MEAQNLYANWRVKGAGIGITHFGAVIGSKEYRDEYVKDLDTLKKLKTEIKKSIEENTKTSSKYYNRKKNALWICQL